jgi:hypothetical protein
VLPLAGKVPAIRRGRGVYDATLDVEIIDQWWREHPDANIGIACGVASGIVVVDVDGDEGRATLAELEAVHGALPSTPRQITGSGGLHLFFAYDPTRAIGNRVRSLPGVDTRSDGGYAVVPPSVHPRTYRRYCWNAGLHPLRLRPAAMPPWLADLLAPRGERSPVGYARPAIEEDSGWGPLPRYSRAALERACAAIASAPVGAQDCTLHRECFSIGRLVGAGLMPRGLARDFLIYAAQQMTNDIRRRPWRRPEIEKKIERALTSGSRRPRDVPS